MLLAALLVAAFAFAGLAQADTLPGGEEPLPRWMTQQERMNQGPPQIATLTPPPDNPVYLDGEFEPKEGILVRWPFYFPDIFAGIVDNAQDTGIVYILVANTNEQNSCTNSLASYGVGLDNVEWLFVTTDAIWVRDFGPWFVDDMGEWSIVDLRYYNSRPHDDYIPEWLADQWDYGYYGPNLYHEGGNMMNDGHGTMMMSTRVLDANPGYDVDDVEQIYHDYFGIDNLHIFQRIANDGTGHIDIWAKMVNDSTIIVADFNDNDVNHDLVEAHAAYMDNVPTANGGTFNIVRIPMPNYSGGYYKTYTNSILINGKAIIPIYGLATDSEAIAVYESVLGPDWDVVGVNCNQIAPLGGELHCVAVEIPLPVEPLAAVELLPVGDPIVIPWGGGSFQFSAVLTNNTDQVLSGAAWTEVITPLGNTYGPILDYPNLTLQPNQTITTATLTQNVPGNVPGGAYEYWARFSVDQQIVAEDMFSFTKTGIAPGPDDLGWTLIDPSAASVSDRRGGLPASYALSEAYPNPFNPTTSMQLNLPQRSELQVHVYNVNGQRVATLFNGRANAGEHTLTLDGRDLSSGVYFVQATVPGQFNQVRKVTLLK